MLINITNLSLYEKLVIKYSLVYIILKLKEPQKN